MMTSEQAFAQGARCGHIEGKERVGLYIVEEEYEMSWDAMEAQGEALPTKELKNQWAKGYRTGYLLGASGDALPAEFQL
jgi:hypothetical protein